jgi:hypothetical protein
VIHKINKIELADFPLTMVALTALFGHKKPSIAAENDTEAKEEPKHQVSVKERGEAGLSFV